MSKRLLRTPLVLVVLLSGAATAFGMPYMPRTAAPGLTIASHPAADTNSTSASFTLSKSGTISSTQCKLDSAAYVTCGTSKSYTGLGAGDHTFWAKVVGPGGTTTKSWAWHIDLTAPADPTTITGGSLTWRNTSATLTASGSTDTGGSGLKGYQHRTSSDGGTTWTTLVLGNPASIGTVGQTITQFRAIDNAGNVSAWVPAVADATNTVRIDKTVPTAPTVSGGSTAWQNTASMTLTPSGSTDPGNQSGFAGEYQARTSINAGATWTAWADSTSVTISNEGETQVQFRAVDVAGNPSLGTTAYARIDRTTPTLPNLIGGGNTWHGATSWSVSASGSTDVPGSGLFGYQYETSTDGGTTWSAPVAGSKATITQEGVTEVQFRSVDKAGFTSAWTNTTVKLDTANPTVPAVTGGSSGWSNGASVILTASGSTDTGAGLLGYQYRKSTDGGGTWTGAANGTTAVITSVGQTIVQFRSTDYSGRHSDWAPVSPTAASTVKIERTAPTAPVVSNSSTDWRDVASVTPVASGSTDSGGSSFNHYEYQSSTDGGSTWSALASGASLPVTAEGTTLVRFQAVDGAGNRSAFTQAQVSIDRSLPTAPTVTGGSYTWATSGTIEIDGGGSTDSPGSGVAGYQYRTSTNGGTTWTTAQTGASDVISADGETIVQFRSVDVYGHFSAWAPSVQAPSNTARLDTTPPNAPTLTGAGATWRTSTPWSVSASATDANGSGIAGYEYETSTDGVTWSAPTSGSSASVSTEGTSYVQFRSIDNVGNVSGWTQGTVNLDSVAPTAPTLTGGGGSWFNTSPQSVSAGASTDATSGVASYQYQTSTDNVTYGAWTAGSSVNVTAQGTTYVRFRAVDTAGNLGSYTQTTVKLDTVAPSTTPTLTGGGSSWFTTSPQSVTASGGSDATSGVASYKYQTSTDNVTWSAATAGSSASISAQGTTYVRFAAVDAAGNTGAYSASVTVKLDTVAPSVPTLTGGGSGWFNTAQTVSASGSTDATSGVASYRYQTSPDNSTWSAATTASSVPISTLGTTYVRFAAVDTAGNVGSYATAVTVKFDNVLPTAPTVSGGSLTCSTSSRTISASGSTDANSGFLRYEYQISTNNGSTWGSVTTGSTVTFSAHGVTSVIQYRSVDNAGNVSAWTPGTNGASNTACVT